MPPELLLILIVGAMVSVAVLVARRVPAIRHVVRTAFDMVDGSLGMYMVRDLLGRDTTTRRERRIAARRAREQAELERRIGGPIADPVGAPAAGAPPVAAAPSRLVVSGDPVVPLVGSATASAAPRGRLLRDATAVLVVGALVVLVGSALVGGEDGAVLSATGTPPTASAPVVVASVSPVPTTTPTPAPTTPSPEPVATEGPTPTPVATIPGVTGLDHRLAGRVGGGTRVPVTLSWTAVAGAGISYVVEERIDGGAWRGVALGDPAATSVRRTLTVGREHAYRITAIAPDGTRGPTSTWRPITPHRHQESSSLARYDGTWRDAEGPSLSGGVVTFTRDGGARVVVRFTGTDIAWIGTRTPQSGRAEVRVDGKRVDTIDLAGPRVQYGRVLFTRHFPERGAHRLEIRALGDGRIDVDAFMILR